ncbi:hypothetical protein GH146_02235 [archaeon]|nr:hypothetical protein [archaeon]
MTEPKNINNIINHQRTERYDNVPATLQSYLDAERSGLRAFRSSSFAVVQTNGQHQHHRLYITGNQITVTFL